MPVLFRDGSLVFYFYSNETSEPPHVHVRKGKNESLLPRGKWWVDPVRREYAEGFTVAELRRAEKLIGERREEILQRWRERFDA